MKISQKLLTLAILLGSEDAARVPKNSPVRKVLKLRRFANEWLETTFGSDSRITEHWMKKFARNTKRFEARFEDCPKSEEEFVAEILAAHAEATATADAADANVAADRKRRQATGGKKGGRGKGGKGNRNRTPKAARIPTEFRRFDRSNASQGIRDITKGFELWARRYVSECTHQPHTQAQRAEKWFSILNGKYEKMIEKSMKSNENQ
jgi:hypothetical protein